MRAHHVLADTQLLRLRPIGDIRSRSMTVYTEFLTQDTYLGRNLVLRDGRGTIARTIA